jgi:peptidoglycan biosynthesis protein MviN/MurJ (putative lipid II flippase)
MLLVGLFGAWGLSLYAGGLDSATITLARHMLVTFIPLAAMTVMVGVYTVRLQASHDHRYALAEALPYLGVLMFLWIWQSPGSWALIAGTLLGTGIQIIWLARLGWSGENTWAECRLLRLSPVWRSIWKAGLIVGMGQFAMSFVGPIDQYFAAGLGPGTVASLGYANRIVALGMTLGATVISRATLTIFSEGINTGEAERIHRSAISWAAGMGLLGAFMALLIWFFAHGLIALLFQRGAFTSADTNVVADALRFGIWQLPFFMSGMVLVSLLAGAGRYRDISLIAATIVICKCCGNYLFSQSFGLAGVMLASVVMYAVSAALCWSAVGRKC